MKGNRSIAAPGSPLPRRRLAELGAASIYKMTTTIQENIKRRTVTVSHRVTPDLKKMLEELARRNFRSTAREIERLIVEAYKKL